MRAVLLNDTRVDNHHGCTTVIETIETLTARNGIDIIARAPAHANWRSNADFLASAETAEVLLVNGEGTIHHDRPAGLALLAAGRWAAERGKPAVMLNMTWQSNGQEAVQLLRDFDIVTVRESASAGQLRHHGITPRIIPDLAAWHRPEGNPKRSGVAYTDNVKGPQALALYRHMWELGARHISILHGRRDPESFARDIRRFAARKTDLLHPSIAFSALRAALIDWQAQTTERDEFVRRVASSELVVTGRFHMLIFCLITGTPFLALGSNTHKNEATLADAGLDTFRLVDDPQSIDAALIEKARYWQDGEAAALSCWLGEGRTAMENLFTDIAKLAPGPQG